VKSDIEAEPVAVICQVCHEGEVNEPCLDYCHVCGKKICFDCVAAENDEHGLLFCCKCVDAGEVEFEDDEEDDDE
jgi:hypothetical protein